MSASPWNLKIEVSTVKKSAKEQLFQLAKRILKVVNAPETIDLKLYKYNIVHKLAEEIEKLSEEKAREILEELKKEVSTCE